MASRRSPKPPPAEIFPSASRRAHRPEPHHEEPVVKDFFVRCRRVLRRLRAKSSLMVLSSTRLRHSHEWEHEFFLKGEDGQNRQRRGLALALQIRIAYAEQFLVVPA